jgi:hypothetical protein
LVPPLDSFYFIWQLNVYYYTMFTIVHVRWRHIDILSPRFPSPQAFHLTSILLDRRVKAGSMGPGEEEKISGGVGFEPRTSRSPVSYADR